jgi:hypothetical protein
MGQLRTHAPQQGSPIRSPRRRVGAKQAAVEADRLGGMLHGDVRFRILHSNQLFPRTQLLVDVGESRFEDITDWLPRAAVELN